MNKHVESIDSKSGGGRSGSAGRIAAILMLLATGAAAATTNTYFVNASSSNPQPPFDTWAKAAADIQTAVNRAQSDLVPGTTECVVLVTNGLYTLTSQIVVNKGITLQSVNGTSRTAINGGYPASTNRCLLVTNCSAVISGFTVSNGFAYGAGFDGQGGGILALDATGVIENCLIRKNRAAQPASVGGDGGGLYAENGRLTVRYCTIEGNDTMGASGKVKRGTGVMVVNGSPFLHDCVISNNVQVTDNGTGAGLYMNAGNGVVSNCMLIANSSSRYAGNYVNNGTVTHCLISNNYARSSGGGITLANTGSKLLFSRIIGNRTGHEGGGGVNANRGLIDNCEILFNIASASSGGGIQYSEGNIRNCLVAGNEAGKAGGGLSGAAKTQYVRNCTIIRNKAGTNGGGVNNASTTANSLLNCIISGNSAPVSNDYYSATTAIGYSCAPELPHGVNGNTTNAPAFAAPGSGTGLTAVLGDYTLASTSPCIDTGNNSADVITTRDLAGLFRVRPLGGQIDMGCYEMPGGGPLSCQFAATPAVGIGPLSVGFDGTADGTNTAGAVYRWTFGDGNVSGWSSDRLIRHTYAARVTPYSPTLEVTNTAGSTASRTLNIQVHPATVYVATNGAHASPFDSWAKAATNLQAAIDAAGSGYTVELVVSNGVYTAPAEIVVGKALPIRSVNGAAATVLKGEYPTVYHRVIRFTAAAGGSGLDGFTITNGYLTGAEGAGLYVDRATVKGMLFRNCLIAGNVNANRSAGGMALLYENAVVSNCQFIGNSQGGGSYRGGGLLVYRGLVVDCLFANNTAIGSYGGGLAATTYASTIRNCRVINNRALRGGGIYNEIAAVQNCLIAGNEATVYGGGVNFLSSSRFSNCTVVRNTAGTAGGGVYQQGGLATNMIVAYNRLTSSAANDIAGTVTNFAYSCSPKLTDGVAGNRTADPRFVLAGSGYGLAWVPGDYRLRLGSPCADTGVYETWMATAVDLQGLARMQNGKPDMGAYEGVVLPPGTVLMVR
jgi:hypothetical protein